MSQGCASTNALSSVMDPYGALALGQQVAMASVKTIDAVLPPRNYGQPNRAPPIWTEPRFIHQG